MESTIKQSGRIGKSGLIIYDGSCGACSLFVGERKSFFEKYGFTVAPLQEDWVPELTGLTESTLLQSIHLFTPDRTILRGADFFHYVCGQVCWLKPIHLILKVPVAKKIFARLYDFLAKRRRKISSLCGLQARAKYPSPK